MSGPLLCATCCESIEAESFSCECHLAPGEKEALDAAFKALLDAKIEPDEPTADDISADNYFFMFPEEPIQ